MLAVIKGPEGELGPWISQILNLIALHTHILAKPVEHPGDVLHWNIYDKIFGIY